MLASFEPMLVAVQPQFKHHPFPDHLSHTPGFMLAIDLSHLVFGFNCIGPDEALLVCLVSCSISSKLKGGSFIPIEKFTALL